MRRLTLFILGTVLCLSAAAMDARSESGAEYRLNYKKSEDSKTSLKIRSVANRMKSMGAARSKSGNFKLEALSTPLVKVNPQGDIEAYIHISRWSDENLATLASLGAEIQLRVEKYSLVLAWIPFESLGEIENLSFVKKITPPSYGRSRVGSVNTQGDAVINANDVRAGLGFDGSGVRVGIISDGIETISSSVSDGDIPSGVIVGNAGDGDEGTALLEIVHDVAPGATLAFSTGNNSALFVNAVNFLVGIGADIIVDDLGFLGEPFFEDGMLAEEAEDAVAAGVVFVSAAGNDADQHYQGFYADSNPGGGDNNRHDFGFASGGGSDAAMRIQIPPLQTVLVVLQWNDPFGNSSNDYDLFLFNPSTGEVIDSSVDVQNGDDDPIETAIAQNTSSGASLAVDVVINRFAGQSRTLEILFNGPVFPQEFNTPEDSVFGHPAASSVIAVGAVPANNPNSAEVFSARGPVSIFFPFFESRPKPEVVAPDRVSTGVAGFSPFVGTSAAAPHVAGVVALMLEADPTLSPSGVANILGITAVDLGAAGFDNLFGFGRVDAFGAVSFIDPDDNGGGDDGGSESSGCALASGGGSAAAGILNMLIFSIPAVIAGARGYARLRIRDSK
ncbi:MAG: S8 family peptidase [Deltaproteobacteria bacterium]